uniref:Uncharacterized protein n=1 Tax=Nilaparvata lugens TaxID=108931 RepID=A0A220XIR3_NILLU|nr:hypothetical protein [Nilaparvata lugens]
MNFFNMYVFTLLLTVALAAVVSADDSKEHHGSYGDGSKKSNSDYLDESQLYDPFHSYSHFHGHESHQKLERRSLLPEVDPVATVQAPIQANIAAPIKANIAAPIETNIAAPLSDAVESMNAAAEEANSALSVDPIAEGAALAGITEDSSPLSSLPGPYVYQPNPYQGYPQGYPPQPPQGYPPQSQGYLPPQPHHAPSPAYPQPYGGAHYQPYPPPPHNHYGPPPPPPHNHYGPPPPPPHNHYGPPPHPRY